MSWACDPGVTASVLSGYQTLPMFASTLQAFMAAQCAIVGDHLWPADAAQQVLEDPNYDFIVVGAGSAGSVVANRLSEVPDWKVLLIEAGGNPTLATEIPQLFFTNIASPIDWGYRTVPQESACKQYAKKNCCWPRGKVLGGCSSINGMYYVRGNKQDYDEWAAAGNTGWSYEEVLPFFKKSENFSETLTEDTAKFHGKDGYLSVESRNDADNLEKLLIQAATELGVKYNPDINGAGQMGITKAGTTTQGEVRHSTARAFLSPIKDRKNLHVLKNAHVTKLLFKPNSNIVSGVSLQKDGKEFQVYAKKEVVVSAGAINTPQLLMLSGIGPKKHLEEIGIEVKADLPVGENLQDHAYVAVYYKKHDDINFASVRYQAEVFAKYMLERAGPLATVAPFRVISFMNTTDPKAASPDTEYHYIFLPPNIDEFIDLYGVHGFDDEFRQKFEELNANNLIFLAAAVLLRPQSRGRILLKSKDPFEHPNIYANYFDHPDDLATIIRSLKIHGLRFGDTPSMKATGFSPAWLDLDACKNYDKQTDEFLICWCRQVTVSLYHPTSTAKMGPTNDESAVVDPELRVRKVERLRVIDASIMPTIVRGNTNAPTIMIGEKGADMIKRFWSDSHTEL